MLTIITVLNGNYQGQGLRYLHALRAGIRRHLTIPYSGYRFICFTDQEIAKEDLAGISTHPIPERCPGWWAKLAIFKNYCHKRVIYFDLDTVIRGDIRFMADYDGDFAMLRDFFYSQQLASGVMAWNGDHSVIFNRWIQNGRPKADNGDQAWISKIRPDADRLQDLYPGKFVSYKVHCNDGIPAPSAVISFHGKPKPHEVNDPEIRELWNPGG